MSTAKHDEERRELARRVRRWSVEDFHDLLAEEGVTRAFLIQENGELTLSHPKLLKPLLAFFDLSLDFVDHEALFIGREEGIPTLFFAAVHDTRRGLAQGGLRFKPYDSLADVLIDNVRLAQGMTRKNALAGLWWGGGKGVLPMTRPLQDNPAYRVENSPERRALFEAYGRFIASLGGIYYTAEDVGTKTSDMNALLSQNRFTTCIGQDHGGSGNPSTHTARGVLRGMEAAWSFLAEDGLTGGDALRGVRVAVQGVGHVGRALVEMLDDLGAKVWISDLDRSALEQLKMERPRLEIVSEPDAIYDLEVDVLAPCAIGAVVNHHTIPRLKVKLVCGASNNILAEPLADGRRLKERGIAFVPDYLCNRMGITNCCDESFGYLPDDVELAAERVYPDTLRVLRHAKRLDITPTEAADQLADLAACELHPMIGHRGRRILDRLIADDWAQTRKGARRGAGPHKTTAHHAALFDPARDEPAIRVRWERAGRFRGRGRTIAAAPISAAGRPDLGLFFSAVLMDVRARALEAMGESRPRRAIGSDPGGLELQLAVERSISYEHQEVGRARFVELCRDLFRRNDQAIREQLHQLGVGFDPRGWLDPTGPTGDGVVERLYLALKDSGLLHREARRSYFDPATQTEVVASSSEAVPSIRGRRTDELEDRGVREHLFVQLDGPARHVERALETGAIVFSDPRWKKRFEDALAEPEPWAITRRHWWGHPIPNGGSFGGASLGGETAPGEDDASEVLSVWFTLAAWTFQALGWPGDAAPEPIAEVHVDPDLLLRWVLPSQLLALHLTGRPAFRRIEVHGALHVPVRVLEPRPESELEALDEAARDHDEERFVARNKRVLMRRQAGTLAEPATLIRRFGADALRLGYLLSINPGTPEVASIAESNLREARRTVQRLSSKISGLDHLIASPPIGEPGGEDDAEAGDGWILSRASAASGAALNAYRERRLHDAARLLISTTGELVRWAENAARRRTPEELRTVAETSAEVVRRLARGFGPICPYLFDRLVERTEARVAALGS